MQRLSPTYVAILHGFAARPATWFTVDDLGDYSVRVKDNVLDNFLRNGFIERRPLPNARRFGAKHEYRVTNVGRAVYDSYADVYRKREAKITRDRTRRAAHAKAKAAGLRRPRTASAA